ncbi:MAG: hypothetical protein QOH00_424 [Gaiellales bacterium]|nr:hypothetical protein [Gaiellales bacterium]
MAGSPSLGAVDPAAPWTGQWKRTEIAGGVITLSQVGSFVTGSYTWAQSTSFHGEVSGDTLTGPWTEAGGGGTLSVTLSPDRQSFSGQWQGTSGAFAGQGGAFSGTRIAPPPPPPPATPPLQPSKTFVVSEGTYKLGGVPSCVRTGSTFQVTLSFKRAKRKGNVVVKVSKAVFTYQGDRVYTAKRAPYRATVRVRGAKAGKTYSIRARAFLKVRHGLARSRSIGQTVKGCSP